MKTKLELTQKQLEKIEDESLFCYITDIDNDTNEFRIYSNYEYSIHEEDEEKNIEASSNFYTELENILGIEINEENIYGDGESIWIECILKDKYYQHEYFIFDDSPEKMDM